MAKSNRTSRSVKFTVTSTKILYVFILNEREITAPGYAIIMRSLVLSGNHPLLFPLCMQCLTASHLPSNSHLFSSPLPFCLCRIFKATCFSLTPSALLYTCRLHMSLHLIIPHPFLLHYFLMIPVGCLTPLHCPFTSFSSRHSISLSLSSFFNTLILAVCNFILSLVSCTLLLTPPISLFFLTWLRVNSHRSCLLHSSLLSPHTSPILLKTFSHAAFFFFFAICA